MLGRFSRTELLLGHVAMEKLAQTTVAIFGIGGVGSYVAEGLARSGIGHFVLVDNDLVCLTNINRQIHATSKTVGKKKTQMMKQRILDINPQAVVDTIEEFFMPDVADKFFQQHYDYIVDAIDTMTGKIALVVEADKRHIPIISCMGAGNKLDPTKFEVADIYKTSVDPLARVMRRELKKQISKIKGVAEEKIFLGNGSDEAIDLVGVVLKIIIFSFLFYVIINVIYSLDDKSSEKVAGNPKIIAIFAS